MTRKILLTSILALIVNTTVAQTVSTTEIKPHSISRWKENLKIGYFGELLGSNLEKWDDNQYDQQGNKTGNPANLYNQFTFQYKFLPTTSLIVSPRFMMQIGDRNELNKNEDQHNVYMDDWLFGVSQEYIKTKKFGFKGRLSHRHPFNTASQNTGIDSQIEYQNDLFFSPTAGHTFIMWNTYRYYAYEARVNEDRYRINTTTIYTYDFTDKWKMQVYHEWDMQHRAPKYGERLKNKQDWNYFEKYKNHIALAFGYSPTPNWTILPFVKALNDEDWSAKTTQLGLWVLGRVF